MTTTRFAHTATFAALALVSSLAMGCSGEVAPEGDDALVTGESEGALSGATFEGGARALTSYFVDATKNQTAKCYTTYSAVGYSLVALSSASGFAAAGAVGIGSCEINGKPAIGLAGIGAGAIGSLESLTLGSAGTVFGQMRVPFAGASVPADAAGADRLFDQAFGAAARGTLSLTTPVKIGERIVGYRASGTVKVTDAKGLTKDVTVAVGVIKYGTQVTAIQTTATGSYARWAI